MRRYFYLVLVIILAGLLISGCSNPDSELGFGPSWDLAIKVPVAQDEGKTVEEIFADIEEVNLSDSIVHYHRTEALKSINIGEEITDIDLPTDLPVTTIQLGDVDLTDVLDVDQIIGISAPVNDFSLSTELTTTDMPFDKVVLSNQPVNQLEISVTVPEGITLNSADLILKNGINGNQIGEEINLTSSNLTGTISLAGVTIDQPLALTMSKVSTTDSGSTVGDLTLNLKIPTANVTYISGFNLNNSITYSDNLQITDIVNPAFQLTGMTFGQGNLQLAVNLPTNSNLNLTSGSFTVGGLSGNLTDNQVDIDLSNQRLSLYNQDNNNQADVVVAYQLKVSGDNITYDSQESISVSGGFTNNPVINKITGRINQLPLSDLITSFDNPVIDDLSIPAEINEVALNDLMVTLNINNLTGDPAISESQGLAIDLSNLQIIPEDSQGNPITGSELKLGELDSESAAIVKGENTLNLVNSQANQDFIDLVKTRPARVEVLVLDQDQDSSNDILLGNSDNEVAITADSRLDLTLAFDLGFDVTLNNPHAEELDPILLDSISSEAKDIIKNSLDSCRLIINELDNQLPVGATLQLYLAKITNGSQLTTGQLKNELYQEANSLAETKIDQKTRADKEIILARASDTQKLIQDDLYLGLRVIIPAGTMILKSTDYLNFGEVYFVVAGKINQTK